MGNKWSGRRRNTTATDNTNSKVLSGWTDANSPPNALPGTTNTLSSFVKQSHAKRDEPDDREVHGITIHRSYSSVSRSEREACQADVSVYRSLKRGSARVTWQDGPRVDDDDDVRRRTLPRQFGRGRKAAANIQRSETLPASTGARSGMRRQPAIEMLDSDWRWTTHEMGDDRAPTGRKSSRRRSCYKVSDDDFPTTSCIKRRVELFEAAFTRDVVSIYTELTETVQLNTLSIAIKRDDTHRRVSLWQFINCPEVAAELHFRPNTDHDGAVSATIDPSDYTLAISPDHFRFIMAARQDRKHVTELVRQLVSAIAGTAAAELARVYEYQLALLGDGLAAEMLAAHSARCVIDYVICGGRYLEPDTIVMGAVKGHARPIGRRPVPIISVIIGERELKWRLDEILKKPGMRREIYLGSYNYQDIDQCPWLFLTSPQHDAERYGYRGVMLERDYAASSVGDAAIQYRVSDDDETTFTTLSCSNSDDGDDFHRRYRPYQRLVAASCAAPLTCADSSAAFHHARDEMKPVVRRLGPTLPVVSSASDNDL